MAYYRFEIKVDAGAHPDANVLIGEGVISNGQKAELNADPGFGPGTADGLGGYSVLNISTEPGIQVGYDGADLSGSEEIWFRLVEVDAATSTIRKVYLIGPYTVGDIGTEVPAP